MNNRASSRVMRRERPPKMTGRDGYRRSEPHLRRDFAYRCAYCMIHEQEGNGPEAFCIDHFKPRSKGGRVNAYTNLYWVCVSCNLAKGSKWPTLAQRRKGYRFADPCREQDYGVHFVENADGELVPQTPCGEYHVVALQLNRERLQDLRRLRNQKQTRLNDALALQQELERAVAAQSDAEASALRRLLAFVRREIELLQAELAVAIPFGIAGP